MNDLDKGTVVYVIWLFCMFCIVFGMVFIMETNNMPQTNTPNIEKYYERVNFCNSNPCICRCESAGNGGLEECTHLCRGGY